MNMTTSQLKKEYIKLLCDNPEIFELIGDENIKYSDDLINTHIFPQIAINFTIQQVSTYIGLKIDYPSISNNELYKNYIVSFMIISNYGHIKTKNGDSRTDLLAEEIIKMFNWNINFGFKLELRSDRENPLDEHFYYRELVFESIISNSVINGVKSR